MLLKPKKNAYFFTCEKYTYADGTVGFSTVRAMNNLTVTSLWCSANDKTYIDGANIYAGSVTAQQIDVANLFAQNITATNFHISGGSIDITTDSSSADKIVLRYADAVAAMRPFGWHLSHKNYTERLDQALLASEYRWGSYDGINFAGGALCLRQINTTNGNSLYNFEIGADYAELYVGASRRMYLGQGGLKFYNSSGTQKSDYGSETLTLYGSSKDKVTANSSSIDVYNTSGTKTASYKGMTLLEFAPAGPKLTFYSSSKISIRKWGHFGVISIQALITNPDVFSTGANYQITMLSDAYKPAYTMRQTIVNGQGNPLLLELNASGAINFYRYAGTSWSNSWVRAEIPVVFKTP